MSRGNNQAPSEQPAQAPGAHHAAGRRKHIDWVTRTVRIELFIVILGCALLLAAVSLFLAFSGTVNDESSLINTSKYQAVFLNGGSTSGSVTYSTYFGRITNLNSKYVVLQDVYYLTTNSTSSSASSSPQLIKLGCQQLHAPYDEMVINRDQIAFWENLQDSGKVVQAIDQYVKQNPNGPNCSQTTSSQSSSSSQPAATTPTTTNTTANTTGQ